MSGSIVSRQRDNAAEPCRQVALSADGTVRHINNAAARQRQRDNATEP
jgi:hypothetical protein